MFFFAGAKIVKIKKIAVPLPAQNHCFVKNRFMSESTIISDRLASEKTGRLIWHYSLPAVTGTVVMALYNIVDRIFIGHGVGALAISGLALTFPFMNILTAFGMLVGSGASARISIALGGRHTEKAEQILANAFILTFIVSGLAVVLSYFLMGDLLRLFGGTENTVQYAEEYMRIIIPGAVLAALNYGFNNIMRASGYSRKAMATMILCALVNVVLDAVFIFVFDMGIRGAAHATNLSFLVGSCWVLLHFLRRDTNIRFRKKYFKLDKAIIKSILSIGFSPFSMQIALSLVVVLMNTQLIRHGGDLAIGAFGIINSIGMLIVMIIIGLNQGVQPIIGYSYGAKLYGRMFKVLRAAVWIATAVSTAGFALGMFIPELLIRLFTTDAAMIRMAADALRITVAAFPAVGFAIVVSNFFQSIGRAKTAVFLSLTRHFIFIIPSLLLLPEAMNLNGVWTAQPVSDALSALAAGITLLIFLRPHAFIQRISAG